MRPRLCSVISEMSYQSRLLPHPSTASRSLVLPPEHAEPDELRSPRLLHSSDGVCFLPVAHQGNSQDSPEEVHLIKALCDELSSVSLHEDGMQPRRLRTDEILVVAPYNLQVRALSSALDPMTRVGTVDRFQGQEAPVVIVSLCASDFDEDAPNAAGAGSRGLSFVLNQNRLNVALSRAQCLAIVVGSPRLLETPPKSLDTHRELNFLCRIAEFAGEAEP